MAKKKKQKRKDKQKNKKKYTRSIKGEILKLLENNRKKQLPARQIARSLGIFGKVGKRKVGTLLYQLEMDGKIEFGGVGYRLTGKSSTVLVGKIQILRAGFGFLLRENEEDIFISPNSVGKALNGDIVKVRITRPRMGNSRPIGIVLSIVERARTRFIGTIAPYKHKNYHIMVPDSPSLPAEFHIEYAHLEGAEAGQKVVVEILEWERKFPVARVVEVLGDAGEHDVEIHAILHHYGFNPRFSEAVEAEAEAIPDKITAQEIGKRRDMRHITTFTIDPVDAKDFDDALSIEKLDNGLFEVGVHIADVSHYVVPGSELDTEAYRRATSIYLVDRVVPMLPEKLSNGICSLRPREEKLTYSAVFTLNEKGQVLKTWIGRTVIYSDHRFHYAEAQAVIDGKEEGPFREELTQLMTFAKKFRAKRMKSGSIDFHSEEVKFVLDDQAKPVKIYIKERLDTNMMIEDWMLLANKAVSKHIASIFQNPPLPSVYRVHDLPNAEKLSNLQQFVKTLGYEFDFNPEKIRSKDVKALLQQVKDKPEQGMIESLAIRSMAKAVYTTKNIGHFGLGFTHYSHFTSPIRRYPDLMIHRLLTKYGAKNYKENADKLEAQCQHCSNQERVAAEAERDSVKYKQVEFMEDKIGEVFDGLISGVSEHGIYIEMDILKCEGMVRVFDMSDDYYIFDEKTYCLRGKDQGKVYRLGDRVKVRVKDTDLQRRTIDLVLVDTSLIEEDNDDFE